MDPIGLVAGSGRFPVLFAQAAAAAGRSVVAVGHEGETDPELERNVARFAWVKLGQLGRIAEALREGGCRQAVFCGEGVRVVSPLPLVPDLLAPAGPLGQRRLTDEQRADADVGFGVARSLGALDVGQTVVVKRGVVLAVEAVEGTDACIARGGALAEGAVVVKAFKPQQDARFDVPAIGPETVAAMQAARCAALALEARKAVVLDRQALASAADRAGIAVEGV